MKTKDRSYMFMEFCLNEWQSRDDLCELMQCDYRTISRYITTFKEMCMTNELSKFIFEQRKSFTEDFLYEIMEYRVRIK